MSGSPAPWLLTGALHCLVFGFVPAPDQSSVLSWGDGKERAQPQLHVRVMKKIDENIPHEILLVLDAGTGQNAVSQTKLFTAAVPVTGLVLTKLDGTAKGGIVFALADRYKLPLRFVGVGEKAEDLRVFHTKPFVEALLQKDE